MTKEPKIIQGGMGAAVSSWQLARRVSQLGQLGVVSGTALDSILIRRLQLGDPDGSIRRAFDSFPFQDIATSIYQKFYVSPVKSFYFPHLKTYRNLPMLSATLTQDQEQILVLANFVEVFLAKESHKGLVGINFLEKIRVAILPSLYGAMLADVDYVLMGAGIPRSIPMILDRLSTGLDVELKLDVAGASSEDVYLTKFSPQKFSEIQLSLRRPKFIPIVSSSTLALTLLKKSEGRVNGFVVETPLAGGHNAPPRGKAELSSRGEPIYGPRDEVDLEAMRGLGVPFWLAGSYGTAEGLQKAQAQGAVGVQVGTAFALSEESGLERDLKQKLLSKGLDGSLEIFTDPAASPTGFPFKVAQLENTLAESEIYQLRQRRCDLGYLRQIYKKPDGSLGYRCPAEPVEAYEMKGGSIEDTLGRKCLCNALLANVGLGQTRDAFSEPPLVTLGNDIYGFSQFLKPGKVSYTAKDVIDSILQGQELSACVC